MTELSDEAWGHLEALGAHYEAKGYLEAAENLLAAVEAAKHRIAHEPLSGAA